MKAGKTNLEVGTRIKTTKKWDPNIRVTGKITHPFGIFGGTDYGAIAGIRIDEEFQLIFGEVSNLMPGDFEKIESR